MWRYVTSRLKLGPSQPSLAWLGFGLSWAIQYCTVHTPVLYCTVRNYTYDLFSAVKKFLTHFNITVQYSTVQYSTVQYSTVQYIAVQYITPAVIRAGFLFQSVYRLDSSLCCTLAVMLAGSLSFVDHMGQSSHYFLCTDRIVGQCRTDPR